MDDLEDTIEYARLTVPMPLVDPQGGKHVHSDGSDDRGLRAARARATRKRVCPVVSPDVAALTVTVVIPAHNEERDLPETLDALMRQTVPATPSMLRRW